MSERVCLIHYHEIGLKGRNRSVFERRLQSNLEAALVGMPVGRVERMQSRLVVRVFEPDRMREVAERIALIPGVSGVSLAYKTTQQPEEMEQVALTALEAARPFTTFRVAGRRANTQYAEPSLEMNRRIGAYLQAKTGAGVDLSSPDATVVVNVTQGDTYISSVTISGPGGLPVGTASRVMALLSAGIDSPVACWRIMRRGAVVVGIHFSGRPQTNDYSERLVYEIGSVLEQTGGLGRIYVVPFGDLQKEVSLAVPPDLRVLMYRRLMIRVAEAVARFEQAKALVTGESLGQVASQTLENIAAVDEAARLPVLRPLIGNDKLEIIGEARAIGTYGLSTQEHADCCTLFMPRNPETHAKMHAVLEAWSQLDVDRMVADALSGLSWRDFNCPAYRAPKHWRTPEGESGWSRAQLESSDDGGVDAGR